MKNHLIIGLGGTGGKIIRSFRKTIYQEFRDKNLQIPGVEIGYLYMDSSKEMMDISDPSWKILGHSVQLGEANLVFVEGADLKSKIQEIDRYPGIKNWIGDTKIWEDILNGHVSQAAGGQKRRLGRFLLASSISDFNNQLNAQVRELRAKSGQTDITFHLCCGLAGGTGSGCIIDAITQIRKNYQPVGGNKYRILLYTLLPERVPQPLWDTGNYHSNGYGALSELNALRVGQYKPFDISGEITERLDLIEPFNGCYVFTIENENGITVDVKDEMPNILADFLYQKIVAVKDISWDTLARRENAENSDNTPESSPEGGKGERAKHFLTFGIKRLATPEEEIKEYLTFHFGEQAALQLRYNNWSDEGGYLEEAVQINFNEYVRQKDNLERWKLTDEHLILSLPIIEDQTSRKWRKINDDWKNFITIHKKRIREDLSTRKWLDELIRLTYGRYEESYRSLGVKKFYEAKLLDKKYLVKDLVLLIERELFDDWLNGVKGRSIFDLNKLLEALIISLEDRLDHLEHKVTQLKEKEAQIEVKLDENKRTWAKTGPAATFFGKRNRILDAVALLLEEFYIYKTTIDGLFFAKKLIQELLEEIKKLNTNVIEVGRKVGNGIDKFREGINERLKEDYSMDNIPAQAFKQQIVKYYQPDTVKVVVRQFIRNENVQKTQSSNVRQAIAETLTNTPTFHLFNERISEARFLDVLASNCGESALAYEESLPDKLLGINIIQRLKERYEGNPHELMRFIKQLVDHSGNYITFNQNEVSKTGPGTRGSNQQITSLAIVLPIAPDLQEFLDLLIDTFKKSKPAHIDDIEFITSSTRPFEITLVSIANLFPLRYLSIVDFLKDKYHHRMLNGHGIRAKIEVHTDGFGDNFPSLFVPTREEIESKIRAIQEGAIPYLLLAKCMNLVQLAENPETGLQQYALLRKDEDGFDLDPIFLGMEFSSSYEKINAESAEILHLSIEEQLATDYLHEEKRLSLKAKIKEEVDQVKAERNNNISDDIYKQYNEAGRKANHILKTFSR